MLLYHRIVDISMMFLNKHTLYTVIICTILPESLDKIPRCGKILGYRFSQSESGVCRDFYKAKAVYAE